MMVIRSDVFPDPFGPKKDVSLAGVDLQVDVPQHLPLAQLYLKILNEKHLCLLCKIFTRSSFLSTDSHRTIKFI
jgi:hypothetical protein